MNYLQKVWSRSWQAQTRPQQLCAVLCCGLITHPSAYRAVQAEIDATVKSGKVPVSPGIVADSVARDLKYLQAAIKEGVRVYPTITEFLPKTVPAEGDTFELDGKQVFSPGWREYRVLRLGYAPQEGHFWRRCEDF